MISVLQPEVLPSIARGGLIMVSYRRPQGKVLLLLPFLTLLRLLRYVYTVLIRYTSLYYLGT